MNKKFLIIFIIIIISIFIFTGLFFAVKITNKSKTVESNLELEYDKKGNIFQNNLSMNSFNNIEIEGGDEHLNTTKNNIEINDSYDENTEPKDVAKVTKNNAVKNKTENNSKEKDINPKKEEQVEKNQDNKTSNTDKNNNVNSVNSTQEINNKNETKEENKQQVERCTNNSNHGIAIGNSNKWFDTREEAISYYEQLISDFGYKLEHGQMTREEYNQKCPYGYEVWSCMFCNKWTINSYFRDK